MKAFPNGLITNKDGLVISGQQGMELRDWFAGQAMAHAALPTKIRQDGWKIDQMDDFPYDQFAKVIYKMADAMIKESEKNERN